jgi:putative PIN family toxin of toxin-antitoxin system
MRVVFDSNIYISALTLPGGSADSALAAALAGRATLLLSEPMLGEILGVLGRKFARDKEQLARTALFLTELAELIQPRTRLRLLADDPDNRVLECAVAGRADLVVTGDRAMLKLDRLQEIEIISLRTFLTRLESRH